LAELWNDGGSFLRLRQILNYVGGFENVISIGADAVQYSIPGSSQFTFEFSLTIAAHLLVENKNGRPLILLPWIVEVTSTPSLYRGSELLWTHNKNIPLNYQEVSDFLNGNGLAYANARRISGATMTIHERSTRARVGPVMSCHIMSYDVMSCRVVGGGDHSE
jgi:hypothetical protein